MSQRRGEQSGKRNEPAARSRRAPAARFDWRLPGVVALLLTLHFVLAVTSVWNKSVTYDELAHLTRGMSYARTGDFRLGPPHPPFAHYWAALPLEMMNLQFRSTELSAWRNSDVWSVGKVFFYGSGNDTKSMLWRGRAMIALLSVLLGWIVYVWSRSLFGVRGGLLSLGLYALSPTMLAHGALVTTDLVSALFFTASVLALWRMSHRVSIGTVVAATLAVGLLFMSKGSAVLLAFMGVVLIGVRIVSGREITIDLPWKKTSIRGIAPRTLALTAITVWLMVSTATMLWGAYGFRWSPFKGGASTPQAYEDAAHARQYDYYAVGWPPEGKSSWEHQSRSLGFKADVCRFLHEWKLLPDAYVYGFLSMLQSARGRDAFFNGERSLYGWRTFFPYAFMVKTPLALFGLLILSGAAIGMRRKLVPSTPAEAGATSAGASDAAVQDDLPYQLLPLLVLLGVYGAVSFTSSLNIGHRHLLSLYPALFVLAGAAGLFLNSAQRAVKAIPIALAVLFAGASLSVFPHYLAFFNLIVGGPSNGYKHLVDSSLDWGQDLGGLAQYVEASGGDRPVFVEYFGNGDFRSEGLVAAPMIPSLDRDGGGDLNLRGGLYAISATSFQQVYIFSGREWAALGLIKNGRVELTVDWNMRFESLYQQMLPIMHRVMRESDGRKRLAMLNPWLLQVKRARPAGWNAYEEVALFSKLRFMRLCAHLRQREPDEQIGYSILIFDLSDDEVTRFISGDAPPMSAKSGSIDGDATGEADDA